MEPPLTEPVGISSGSLSRSARCRAVPPSPPPPAPWPLHPADTYTVTAKVGTATATLPTGMGAIVYGAQSQGLIQRLVIGRSSATSHAAA